MSTRDDLDRLPLQAPPDAEAAERGAGAPKRSVLKRFLPRTLFGRSLLIILLPLVLLQIIITWVFYDRHYELVTRRLSQAVAGDVAALVEVLDRRLPDWQHWLITDLAQTRLWLRVRLLDEPELMPPPESFWPSILETKLESALAERLRRPFMIDVRSMPKDVRIQVDMGDQILDVLVSRQRLFTSTTYLFIAWMLGSSFVLSLIAVLFMRKQVKPIRRLAQVAESFGRGLDVPDFKPEGASEVRQAALAFLRMRERIRRQIAQRTTMLAGVSHDLRTPLTRMKLELAMLGNTPEVENLKLDVQHMEQMIEGYLAFARGEGRETPRETDVSELLRQSVQQVRRNGASVDLHVEQRLVATVRRDALRRCLANLLDNARRYGGSLSVTAGRRGSGVEILVDDDGPGIPEGQREEVFRPFFRLEESRNPETGGTGLGLTIARDVARSHGGDLTLEEAPGGGLRARLWLPA